MFVSLYAGFRIRIFYMVLWLWFCNIRHVWTSFCSFPFILSLILLLSFSLWPPMALSVFPMTVRILAINRVLLLTGESLESLPSSPEKPSNRKIQFDRPIMVVPCSSPVSCAFPSHAYSSEIHQAGRSSSATFLLLLLYPSASDIPSIQHFF